MGKKKKNKHKKHQAPVQEVTVQEAEAAEEILPDAEAEETVPKEEVIETETTEAEEPGTEIPEETQILTEELKEIMEETEQEDIIDAQIREGILEAAEAFMVEQEIDHAGEDIAEELGRNNSWNYVTGGRKMNEMNERTERETAEVKTVYIKEKERTGWWKIVMLIVAIVAALAFCLTAVFAGLGVRQLNKISEAQVSRNVYYDEWYGDEYPGGYGNRYENGGNSGYGSDGYSLDDLFDFFGYGDDSDYNYDDDYYSDDYNYGQKTDNNKNGSEQKNENSSSDEKNLGDELFEFFGSLFGGSGEIR